MRFIKAGALGAGLLLLFAPSALAGTVRFGVTPTPQFSVKDNGSGIVKLTFRGCLVAGVRQRLSFRTMARTTKDSATADFNVLKAEGQAPDADFSPSSIFLTRQEKRFTSTLSFSLPAEENNGVTTFRIKLDPRNGEGLGQGAGIMVSIPCVVPARSGSRAFSAPRPTTSRAPCINVRRVRLRAGERRRVVTRVVVNGLPVFGARVRISFGNIARTKSTDERGYAIFSVRPRRSGTLFVQTDVCSGADRLRVRRARRTSGRAAPRTTG